MGNPNAGRARTKQAETRRHHPATEARVLQSGRGRRSPLPPHEPRHPAGAVPCTRWTHQGNARAGEWSLQDPAERQWVKLP